MITSRRTFLGLLAAPAIIRVADLMPVRTPIWMPDKEEIWKGRCKVYTDADGLERHYLRVGDPTAPPAATTFPDATTTGYGSATLTNYPGIYRSNYDGEVISNLHIGAPSGNG